MSSFASGKSDHPSARTRNKTPEPRPKDKSPGVLDQDAVEIDTCGTYLNDVFCPRQPDEGFFTPFFPRFITEEGARNLPTFKYRGSDASLMYQYVLSPLAAKLTELLIPKWFSANLLTVLGLVPSIIGYSTICYYSPDLKSKVPSWCWLLQAFCTFVYQTIDNMDGKQARRTGSSTALGLLIDHSVDAINISMGSLSLMAVFHLGDNSTHCFLTWLTGAFPFFFGTWEEFYTGALAMPAFNGPTDGVISIVVLYLISGLADDYTKWWDTPAPAYIGSVWGLTRKHCVMLFALTAITIFMILNVITVVTTELQRAKELGASPRARRNKHQAPGKPRVRDALAVLIPFVMGSALFYSWLQLSHSAVFFRHPRLVFVLAGLVFTKLVTHLQLSFVCGETYFAWRKTFLVPLGVISLNSAVGYFARPGQHPPVDESLLLQICVAGAFLSWLQMSAAMMTECAEVLNIRVFSLRPREKNAAQNPPRVNGAKDKKK